jgi:hypothetical protein
MINAEANGQNAGAMTDRPMAVNDCREQALTRFDCWSISAILIFCRIRYVALNSQRSSSSLIETQQSVINKSENCDRGNKQEDAIQAKTSVNPNPVHGPGPKSHSIQFDSCRSVHS